MGCSGGALWTVAHQPVRATQDRSRLEGAPTTVLPNLFDHAVRLQVHVGWVKVHVDGVKARSPPVPVCSLPRARILERSRDVPAAARPLRSFSSGSPAWAHAIPLSGLPSPSDHRFVTQDGDSVERPTLAHCFLPRKVRPYPGHVVPLLGQTGVEHVYGDLVPTLCGPTSRI